jgi:hypothetical protein
MVHAEAQRSRVICFGPLMHGESLERREIRMRAARITSAALVVCLASCACSAGAEQSRPAPPTAKEQQPVSKAPDQRATIDPTKFALIVAGAGGEETFTRKFGAQAMQLHETLTMKLGFDEKQVFLLTEGVSGGPEEGTRANVAKATADEVRKAIASIKAAANPNSFVFVVMVGHGAFDNQQGKFNLLGPDLTAGDYAALINALPTRRVVFVNCASSSGEFVKPLSGDGHVIITATRSGNEQNATNFAEHFIDGLANSAADGDKSGRISVLEAFNYATKLTAEWYKKKDRLATEHALIDDNGDGVGHEEAAAGDGALAKTTYLDSKPVEQAGADAELLRLLGERQKLEEAIERLKLRKAEMKEEDYLAELERLLVELAKLNEGIKTRQK